MTIFLSEMALHHPIPPYIPLEARLGSGIRLTDSLDTDPVSIPLVERGDATERKVQFEDAYFLGAILAVYQARPFLRGNLYPGRLSRLFGWEIVPAGDGPYDPTSWRAVLRVDLGRAASFFELFE